MASAFTASGLKVGDRIAGKPDPAENFWQIVHLLYAAIVANSITAVVLALAATSIGAIFSSTATDLGVPVSPFCHIIIFTHQYTSKGGSRQISSDTAQNSLCRRRSFIRR
jgi:hypothetical protein